jgi:hypothetical protein
MDLFTRIAKANYVSRGGGAGQDHADEMMALDGADRDPELRIRELEAEVRNVRAEVWWLRGVAILGLVVAIWGWIGHRG